MVASRDAAGAAGISEDNRCSDACQILQQGSAAVPILPQNPVACLGLSVLQQLFLHFANNPGGCVLGKQAIVGKTV